MAQRAGLSSLKALWVPHPLDSSPASTTKALRLLTHPWASAGAAPERSDCPSQRQEEAKQPQSLCSLCSLGLRQHTDQGTDAAGIPLFESNMRTLGFPNMAEQTYTRGSGGEDRRAWALAIQAAGWRTGA